MADQGIQRPNGGSQSGGGQRPPVGRPAEAYEWPEVKYSSYAIFLSYLMMAMRGLNILIFTWSTVVLLGGFVSMLRKDFWCLTIITLVQVPGLFNPAVRDKLIWLEHLPKGLGAIVPTSGLEASRAWHIVGHAAQVAAAPVAVVGGICLMLVVGCGVPIAAGLSLWRMMQRDYGVAKDDDGSKANLTPALDVLYSLVVLQSAFFWLSSVFDVAGLRLAEAVVREYQVGGSERPLFEAYFAETKVGCCKDLSFAKGRNLVTYAVGMMGSEAPTSYVAGLRILASLFGPQWPPADLSSLDRRTSILRQRWVMVAQLLTGSPSSGHIVQRLLSTVGPTNPYGGEAREPAARVVKLISHDINLEQFPQGIQRIASLLEDGGDLSILGLSILHELADSESNCRVMSDNPGLLSMIVPPASFHADHDAVRHERAQKSLKFVCRLVTSSPGMPGAKLRHQIANNEQAVSAMESILECDECRADLQPPAMNVLELLHFCTASGQASKRREKFVRILVSIFAGDKKHTTAVRIEAANNLGHICQNHSDDVEYPLKEEIINGIRKVQNELICCESSGGAEANDRGFSEPRTTDLEANVVRLISHDINLEQFPRGIRCIASLLDISDEHRDLVFHGLKILCVLADSECNCRVMSDTPDLLSMVVASASFHADHDAVRYEGAQKLLDVVCRLINSPGETGAKMRHQIVSDEQAVSAMESILECDECRADLQERTMNILEVLHFCQPSGEASERRAKFVRILVSIFAGDKKHTTAVRIEAANNLGHICQSHSDDVEYPVKEEIINGIRKVRNELNCCESSGGAEGNDRGFSEPSTDLEAQLPSQDIGCNGASSSSNQQNSEQRVVDELKAVVVRLHETVSEKMVSTDTYLPPRDDGAASESCVAKPHGRRGCRGKQMKHGKRSGMMAASLEEEEEPLL